jgi:hypothetical protein
MTNASNALQDHHRRAGFKAGLRINLSLRHSRARAIATMDTSVREDRLMAKLAGCRPAFAAGFLAARATYSASAGVPCRFREMEAEAADMAAIAEDVALAATIADLADAVPVVAPAHTAEGHTCAQCGAPAIRVQMIPFCAQHNQATLLARRTGDFRRHTIVSQSHAAAGMGVALRVAKMRDRAAAAAFIRARLNSSGDRRSFTFGYTEWLASARAEAGDTAMIRLAAARVKGA